MTWRPRSFRAWLVSGPEFGGIALFALVLTLWGVLSRGAAGLDVAPFGLAFSYFCILTGRLLIDLLRLPADRFRDIPTTFLFGFLALNTLLLFVALALPFSLPVDALLIALGVGVGALRLGPAARVSPFSVEAPGLACLALSLVAATLWSLDSIMPEVVSRGVVVFNPWADSFLHACVIRMFRDAHGVFTLEHFSIAGEPVPPYHYASYMIPALLAALTDTSCYLAFTSFLVPLGIVLTGLAAFVLARWWWSAGAGLAAAVALLLLPDASRYGVANPFLGYHWLAQTGPALVYGVAMIAVAWVLVFEGCRAGRLGLVAAGFVAAGLTVVFKAHLFVANAFLIWVYPAFFLRAFRLRMRLAWLGFSIATFAAAVRLSQRSPSIPLLRLDGSGLKPYMMQVIFNLNREEMRRIFRVDPTTSWTHDLVTGVVHLSLGTFGVFAIAFPIMAFLLARNGRRDDVQTRAETALFPFFVVVNYLIMSLGLARDDRGLHTSEELLHRPLVWAYFAVATWTGGCFYELVLKNRLARPGLVRAIVPVMLTALLTVPFVFGRGVQVGPTWGKEVTSMQVPVGLVRSAQFLRATSAKGQIVQNSEGDKWVVLSAFAERPTYAVEIWEMQVNKVLGQRLDEMKQLRRLTDPARIAAFAARRKIAWYVLDPATRIDWPASILSRPVFESGGYRVYRFASRPGDGEVGSSKGRTQRNNE